MDVTLEEAISDIGLVLEKPVEPTPEATEEELEADARKRYALDDEVPFGDCGTPAIEEVIPQAPQPIDARYSHHQYLDEDTRVRRIYRAIEYSDRAEKASTFPAPNGEQLVTEEHEFDHTWVVRDRAKGVLYMQQRNLLGAHCLIGEDDLFIWLFRTNNLKVDVGYIHNGHVFLRRTA